MNITLDKLKETFAPPILKKAALLTVRELDETPKGTFVAYVDEGSDSYDVTIVLKGTEVTEHNCDCQAAAKKICIHQTAVLLQLASPKDKQVSTVAKAKKANPLQQIVDDVPANELKTWVLELLIRQKDLQLEFLTHFKVGAVEYTPEKILQITTEAAKSIVKNKRKIDQTEVKKIVQLWDKLHRPILDEYYKHITDTDKIAWIVILVNTIEQSHERFYEISTNKFTKYKEDLLLQIIPHFDAIIIEDAWQKVILAWMKIALNESANRSHTLLKFVAIIATAQPLDSRANFIIQYLAYAYINMPADNTRSMEVFTKILWDLCKAKNNLSLLLNDIKPIFQDNVFNIELIEVLLAHEKYALAEKYCNEIIRKNSNLDYNIPYLKFLKLIYKKSNRVKELIQILLLLVPVDYSFMDYMTIMANIEEGEWKKFRSKIHLKAVNNMRYSRAAAEFYYTVCIKENGFVKLWNHLYNCPFLDLLIENFEPLFINNKLRFLEELIRLDLWMQKEIHQLYFENLWQLIKSHYLQDEIRFALLNNVGYHRNSFATYIKAQMPS